MQASWRADLVAVAVGAALLCFFSACSLSTVPAFDPREGYPGGKASTSQVPFPSGLLPAPGLDLHQRPNFFAGKALAEQPWVKAPSITSARDGLGPLFNQTTCLGCHRGGGKGNIPSDGAPFVMGVVRLSVPGQDLIEGAVAEPTYGLDLQVQSTSLSHHLRGSVGHTVEERVAPEARILALWEDVSFRYPDGGLLMLRRPKIQLDSLGYGRLHAETRMSLRVAPNLFGAGLVELIAQVDLNRLEDPNDVNHDGVSGRRNQVWDFRKKARAPGRFGLKANRASLEITIAGAFAGDLGVTNTLFPNQPCSEEQAACEREPEGAPSGEVELPDALLALVVDFNRNLGVPKRSPTKARSTQAGRELFYELGCSQCHHPRFVTEPSSRTPHLGGQVIWPYSDFLLHDMGPELGDGRPDYEATGTEWRTAPLWGTSVSAAISGAGTYLHDGRARSVEEAILWHGGEGEESRQQFMRQPSAKRKELLSFVESL